MQMPHLTEDVRNAVLAADQKAQSAGAPQAALLAVVRDKLVPVDHPTWGHVSQGAAVPVDDVLVLGFVEIGTIRTWHASVDGVLRVTVAQVLEQVPPHLRETVQAVAIQRHGRDAFEAASEGPAEEHRGDPADWKRVLVRLYRANRPVAFEQWGFKPFDLGPSEETALQVIARRLEDRRWKVTIQREHELLGGAVTVPLVHPDSASDIVAAIRTRIAEAMPKAEVRPTARLVRYEERVDFSMWAKLRVSLPAA